jgi:hypothetical protein
MMTRQASVFVAALSLLMAGCEVNVLSPPPPPPPATIMVDYEWWYDGRLYSLDLTVFEEDYQSARHAPRLPHEPYYDELVSYALGPGYAEAGLVADGLWDLAAQSRLGHELLPMAVGFIQEAGSGAAFGVSMPFRYPLESLVTGGRSSADQAALGAAVLENLGYAAGIAVFWSTWGGSVHASAAISDRDWEPHDYDNLGMGWTFLEMTACGPYRPAGCRPSWFYDYDAWIVWPLWESIQAAPSPRIGGKAQANPPPVPVEI